MVVATLKEHILLTYSLRHLSPSDKVRFYYALKGRGDKKGVLAMQHVEQIAKTVLLAPEPSAGAIREFLSYWKCNITERRIFIQ